VSSCGSSPCSWSHRPRREESLPPLFNGIYRQVFTDGRPLPVDPHPSWQGYSTATCDGDTLVIETIGFNDDVWLELGRQHGDERRQGP
jgi:hypothetical protein